VPSAHEGSLSSRSSSAAAPAASMVATSAPSIGRPLSRGAIEADAIRTRSAFSARPVERPVRLRRAWPELGSAGGRRQA
jgi:hypothetical protein